MSLQKLNSGSFDEIVHEYEEACLVFFSRKSCHVCQEVGPILEELEPKYEGEFGFYYVDVEEEKSLFQKFSLKGVPQILFFNAGNYQQKLVGKVEDEQVEEKIKEIIG